jgi:hypothetical protein
LAVSGTTKSECICEGANNRIGYVPGVATKRYPWFYTVNDRPVQIVELRGGSTDCLVYDHKTGNFVTDRSYLAYVTPGSGKDVDELNAAEFGEIVKSRRADLVKRLAERMCAAKSTSEQDLLEALGVGVKPAPLGGVSARVRGGNTPTFEVDLPEGVLLKGDLDARLGDSRQLPVTGPRASINLMYGVDVPGAAHRCSVFARFDREPSATTPLAAVMFRLDPA